MSIYGAPTDLQRPAFMGRYALNAGMAANPQLWNGLSAAYAPMLGVTGIIPDLSGHKYHGTNSGADWYFESGFGPVLRFVNANNDSVLCGQVFPTDYANEWSVHIVCRATSANGRYAWSQWNDSKGVLLQNYSGDLQIVINGVTAITVSDFFDVTDWRSLTVVYNRTSTTLYVNGALQTSYANALAGDWEPINFSVGNRHAGERAWDGDIGVCYVYMRSLSRPEMRRLHYDCLAIWRVAPLYVTASEVEVTWNPWYAYAQS